MAVGNPLGVHLQMSGGWPTVERVKPHVLKIVSTALDYRRIEQWRAARPGGILIYRHYFPNEQLGNWQWRCDTMIAALAPIKGLVSYVEAPWNEAWQRHDELASYANYTVAATRYLQNAGYKVAVGNFSAGNPTDFKAWNLFHPVLEVADALSLHEYAHPTMQTQGGWLCLRYRRVLQALPRDLHRPILITECGLDSGDKRGWRTWANGDAAEYARQLQWYRDELAKDGAVGVVFTAGANEDWQDYAIDGVPEIAAVLSETTTPQPEGNGGGSVSYAVGEGIKGAMDALGDKPVSDEVWVGHLGSYAEGERNRYHYNAERNQVYVSFPTARP